MNSLATITSEETNWPDGTGLRHWKERPWVFFSENFEMDLGGFFWGERGGGGHVHYPKISKLLEPNLPHSSQEKNPNWVELLG